MRDRQSLLLLEPGDQVGISGRAVHLVQPNDVWHSAQLIHSWSVCHRDCDRIASGVGPAAIGHLVFGKHAIFIGVVTCAVDLRLRANLAFDFDRRIFIWHSKTSHWSFSSTLSKPVPAAPALGVARGLHRSARHAGHPRHTAATHAFLAHAIHLAGQSIQRNRSIDIDARIVLSHAVDKETSRSFHLVGVEHVIAIAVRSVAAYRSVKNCTTKAPPAKSASPNRRRRIRLHQNRRQPSQGHHAGRAHAIPGPPMLGPPMPPPREPPRSPRLPRSPPPLSPPPRCAQAASPNDMSVANAIALKPSGSDLHYRTPKSLIQLCSTNYHRPEEG